MNKDRTVAYVASACRELENIVQAATIHAGSELVRLEHLPKPVRGVKPLEATSRTSFNAAPEHAKNQERCKELNLLMANTEIAFPPSRASSATARVTCTG